MGFAFSWSNSEERVSNKSDTLGYAGKQLVVMIELCSLKGRTSSVLEIRWDRRINCPLSSSTSFRTQADKL